MGKRSHFENDNALDKQNIFDFSTSLTLPLLGAVAYLAKIYLNQSNVN